MLEEKTTPTQAKNISGSRNRKTKPEKLKMKHYDPRAYNAKTGKTGMHILFEETKI
jgi:ribosomal protein L33